MYLLLLVFGVLLGVAGVVLAGSGVSLRDGTFDAAIITPGIVAAIGGLLLIGLGAGLRTLQRIERALASRSMPPTLPVAESATAPESIEVPREPAQIPFAPKTSRDSQSAAALPGIGDVGAKTPETALGAADKVSPSPIPTIAVPTDRDAHGEANAQRVGKSGNGAASTRTGLRFSANLRSQTATERQSGPSFDTLWPKGPRPARAVEAATAPAAQAAGVTPVQSQQSVEPPSTAASHAGEDAAGAEVTILKSGVVNGMPYTLFSDGSIEAQLPEGTLRFGSITELRNHIEQSA